MTTLPSARVGRILLALCGLIAAGIGLAILFFPAAFHATHGIDLSPSSGLGSPSLLSEVRAPGGALVGLGLFMLIGVFSSSLFRPALTVAATVYLSYGGARLLSLGLDGTPDSALIGATILELILGVACAVGAWRWGSTQPGFRSDRFCRPNVRGSVDRQEAIQC